MPFDFDLDDLLDFEEGDNLGASGAKILAAQTRETGGQPMKTTASQSGFANHQVSTVNLGTLMMGAPLYNDGETALKRQEYLTAGLIGGSLGGAEEAVPDLGGAFDLQVPADVKYLANQSREASPGGAGGVGAGGVGGAAGGGVPINQIVDLCIKQDGDTYTFGAASSGEDPSSFDCSSLIQWASAKCGITIPRVSSDQFIHCRDAELEVTVELAQQTRGALLFRFSSEPTKGVRPARAHVAMSLGDGRTIEAKGRDYGVGIFSASNGFTHAALIPGANYGSSPNADQLPRAAVSVPGAGGVSGAGAGGVPAPANASTWTVTKYETATTDSKNCQPGAKALMAYYTKVTGLGNMGCYNYRPIRGGGGLSVHSEGRATDLSCNALDAGQKAKGDQFAQWIIDHVHEIGVQYFIWNRRSWRWDRGWRDYTGTDPHTNHLHVELTRAAAANVSPLLA